MLPGLTLLYQFRFCWIHQKKINAERLQNKKSLKSLKSVILSFVSLFSTPTPQSGRLVYYQMICWSSSWMQLNATTMTFMLAVNTCLTRKKKKKLHCQRFHLSLRSANKAFLPLMSRIGFIFLFKRTNSPLYSCVSKHHLPFPLQFVLSRRDPLPLFVYFL